MKFSGLIQNGKSSVASFLPLILALFFACSCKKTEHPQRQWSEADSLRIIQEILTYRAQVDSFFRYDLDSPFRRDTSIDYRGIHWYPPDITYYLQSKLYRYTNPETVTVAGTYADEQRPLISSSVGRKHLKYGYFLLHIDGKELRLNVYKSIASDEKRSALYNRLKVWFTDETTGKETYGPGRSIEGMTESPDPDFVYRINFNNAVNPYCAYSALYSCALPRREDHLDVVIRAGEMKYSENY